MKCYYCNKNTTSGYLFWRTEHWCANCGYKKKLCNDHRIETMNFVAKSPSYLKNIDLCNECFERREKVVNNIQNINELHNTSSLKLIGTIDTNTNFLNKELALWVLKYNAHYIGGNIITNVTLKEEILHEIESPIAVNSVLSWTGKADVYKKLN